MLVFLSPHLTRIRVGSPRKTRTDGIVLKERISSALPNRLPPGWEARPQRTGTNRPRRARAVAALAAAIAISLPVPGQTQSGGQNRISIVRDAEVEALIQDYARPLFKYRTIKLPHCRRPSESFLFIDRVMVLRDGHYSDEASISFAWGLGNAYAWYDDLAVDGAVRNWFHKTGVNIAMVDGSVRYLTRRQCRDIAIGQKTDVVWYLQPQTDTVAYEWGT